MSIDRSRSSAVARISASLMLMRPRITESNSESEERRSSSTNDPLMLRFNASSEPKAYWNKPDALMEPLLISDIGLSRSPIRNSPCGTESVEASPSKAKNICGKVPKPPASDKIGRRMDCEDPFSVDRSTSPGSSMHHACVVLSSTPKPEHTPGCSLESDGHSDASISTKGC